MSRRLSTSSFFFFNDTATTEIYTLSLHDALPICYFDYQRQRVHIRTSPAVRQAEKKRREGGKKLRISQRSEEHTSELQSPCNIVCRLLLEKKKKDKVSNYI